MMGQQPNGLFVPASAASTSSGCAAMAWPSSALSCMARFAVVIDSGTPPGRDGAGGPYLTLFTASMGGIDMESEVGARTVLDAMASAEVSDADRLRMMTIMLRLASDAARQILEAMMSTSEFERTFVERIRDQGISEGKAESVLRLLDAQHLAPSDEQRQRVMSCADSAQLDRWFDRAITVSTAAEVFAD
jgi:hypothetical protein